jgi:hypothetical protein
MASPVNAALCALVATAIWTVLGYALSRRILPRPLAVGTAPVMGWAVHSAVTLPLFTLIGFTPAAVIGIAALCVIAALLSLKLTTNNAVEHAPRIPAWAFATAALLALVPAVAILPKVSGDLVYLADPIFDHSKIAIIDAMARQGLPPVDPVYGGSGNGQLFYYYLWHYSAAELALASHVSGWEADIALTWFTSFASLSLMMGLAVWLSTKSSSALLVVVFAAATSLRPTLAWLLGAGDLKPFMEKATGFAGWLFQAVWAPQHLMSASCVVASIMLISSYARQQSVLLVPLLALIVAAGFESSTYVGGITFAVAALVAAPFMLCVIKPAQRGRFVVGMATAAALAVIVAAPFLQNQFHAVATRDGAAPIAISHFPVLDSLFPETLRRVLDLPAYWLVLLPIEFPATYIAGMIALIVMLRSGALWAEKFTSIGFASMIAAGLMVSWLLVSTIGDNNDLAMRAVLPAASVLIVLTAVGVALVPRRAGLGFFAIVGLLLSLPDTIGLIRSNIDGSPRADGAVFAQTPEMWKDVRQYVPPDARVANNPLFLSDLTPWPANVAWALLANRSSCFAGREMVLALAPLPDKTREAVNEKFVRVFAGEGSPQDVSDIAKKYGCDAVVLVPQDKAWSKDPFASSSDYRLAENRDGKWRIYTVVKAGQTAH